MDYIPILAKNLDVSKIRYGPLKKSPVGSKSVYVNYAGDKLAIQFPMMHIPYDVSDGRIPDKNGKKDMSKTPAYSMNLSFKGMDDSKAIKNLFDKLLEIENKIKKDVYANRVTWLNDRFDDDERLVAKLFSSSISYDKDKDTKEILNRYPPTFRVKIPSNTETVDGVQETVFRFDATDMENNELNFQNIVSKLKGGKSQLIVHLMGLWFAAGKYGCTWKVLSGRFQVPRNVKYTYVEDSDDEGVLVTKQEESEEEIEADVLPDPPSPPRAAKKQQVTTYVAPSDDEEEEAPAPPPKKSTKKVPEPEPEPEEEEDVEEEEDDEPSPPPPPPKKTVAKKPVKK